MNIAEERHQEAMLHMTSTTNEHHQQTMMSLANEANLAMQEQARGHASALERYQQEAVLKTAADRSEAQPTFYEVH